MDSSLDDSATAATPALPSGDDLSAIAWVQEELRRSLDAAHKSLRRFIKDLEAVTGSDLDSVDPGVLRAARAQIHQGVGALELVGLPAAAVVLRASESAVQKSIARPQALTPELVTDIERSSFALLDYLARILAGKNVSSLSLFPQYRAVQEAVEAERVHPADLWAMDWRWREIENDPSVAPHTADAEFRTQMEAHLLQLMRGTQALTASAKMSELCGRASAAGSRASAGAHLLEPRRGDVRGAAPRPAAVRRLHQAGRVAPAGAVPDPEPRRLRRLRAAGARPAVLLRPGRAGLARAAPAAPDRGPRRLRPAGCRRRPTTR